MNISLPTIAEISSYGYREAVLILDKEESWWLDSWSEICLDHLPRKIALAKEIALYCDDCLVYHEVNGKTLLDDRGWHITKKHDTNNISTPMTMLQVEEAHEMDQEYSKEDR